MTREVLIVDDDEFFRSTLTLLLQGLDYSVAEAASPAEAIEALEAHSKNRVILLDLNLGADQHATEVLDYLVGRTNYRTIVLTGEMDLLSQQNVQELETTYRIEHNVIFDFQAKIGSSQGEKRSWNATGPLLFSLSQAFRDLDHEDLRRKTETLLAVQQKITQRKPLEETLKFICECVRTMVDGYTCHIRVYDLKLGDYHLKGFTAAAPELAEAEMFTKPKAKGDFFSGGVAKSGKAEAYADVQDSALFRDFAGPLLAGERGPVSPAERDYIETVRGVYVVPIFTRLFGAHYVDAVINVTSKNVGHYDAARCARVQEFVPQAALALSLAWLEGKREEIHEDNLSISKMLAEMSSELRVPDALQRIYDIVTQRVAGIINAEVVTIFRVNESGTMITNVAEYDGGRLVPAIERLEEYAPNESLTGAVWARNEAIKLPGASGTAPLDDEGFSGGAKYRDRMPSKKVLHYIGVPIGMGGTVFGVLRAVNKKSKYYTPETAKNENALLERGFSEECRHAVEITASHLAVAIRSAMLFGELERLGTLGRLINSDLDFEGILVRTVETLQRATNAQIAMIFLVDDSAAEPSVVLRQSTPIAPFSAIYKFGENTTGTVAASRESKLIVVNETTRAGKYDTKIRPHLSQKNGRLSVVAVPVVVQGETRGVMKVINKVGHGEVLTDDDLKFCEDLAAYVGVALGNAKAHEVARAKLQAEEEVSLVSRLIAHEVGQTYGLIPGNVTLIEEDLARLLTSKQQDRATPIKNKLTVIAERGRQAGDIAQMITGFSARKELKVRDINNELSLALEGVRELVQNTTEHKTTSVIETALSKTPLLCEIEPRPFEAIVRNLVLNAFQAIGPRIDGRVIVSTRASGDNKGNALITFSDNGPGMDPEFIKTIFEPGVSTKPRGAGLGLWFVRRRLALIDASIEVKSASNKGATFTITLPRLSGNELPA